MRRTSRGGPAPQLIAVRQSSTRRRRAAPAGSAARGGWCFPLLAALLVGCTTPVAGNLDEGRANRIVVALDEQGVVADKERDPEVEGRYRIIVARDDASTAIGILSRENLPAAQSPGVLDTLGQGGLVPSRSSEQARLIVGTAGDLERSLLEVDGVLSARVHLAIAAHDPLDLAAAAQKPTASVLIRYHGATPPIATDEVKRLVAGAVPELEPEQVAVVASSVPAPPATSERELARFGPVTATRGSMLPLRLGVGLGVLMNLALITLLLFLSSRLRRVRGEIESLRQQVQGDPRGPSPAE